MDVTTKVLTAFPVQWTALVDAKFPSVEQVQQYIRRMKAITAAGPDGWKQSEISALPAHAVEEFINL
eukprot:1972653-Amphidinium_carterae.1